MSKQSDLVNVAQDAGTDGYVKVTDASTSGTDYLITSGSRYKFFGSEANNVEIGSYSASNTSRNVHMSIDSSGNVGIGTSSPSLPLEVYHATNSRILASTSNTGASQFCFGDDADDYVGRIYYDHNDNTMRFHANSSERMRIDGSGNLLVGTTSGLGYGPHQIQSSQSSGGVAVLVAYNSSTTDNSPAMNAIKGSSTTSSSARFIQFYANAGGTPMGGIVGNGASNVQFGSISDAREKTNIQSISGSLNKIIELNPVEFDWITNGEHVSAGFVAQEVEQIFPEFVIENIANDGQEERKGLTGGMTGGIIAHLVKAIQEQQTIIETLEARVAALEAV